MPPGKGFSGSRRLGLDLAPAGLCFVQDVVNSVAIPDFGIPDLLADTSVAQRWLTEALRSWSEQTDQPRCEMSMGERDLAPLRRLRADLRDWLVSADTASIHVPAKAMTVGIEAGHPVYRPRGDGAAGVTALVGMEVLLASQAATAQRLKICMNPDCGAAFYDMSRNGSRVWHDVKTCGNVANLRALRARRREAATAAHSERP
jgi:hypothetical protein